MSDLKVSVGGDAAGGWLVDIHDGDNHGVYNPAAENAEAAGEMALEAHKAKFPPAPPSPPPVATPDPAVTAKVDSHAGAIAGLSGDVSALAASHHSLSAAFAEFTAKVERWMTPTPTPDSPPDSHG